jgi:hypothetical protein
MSDYISIEEQFDDLYLKYIKRSLLNNNELISDLIDEYWNYSVARELEPYFANTKMRYV